MPSEASAPLAPTAPLPSLPASLHVAVHASLESVESRWREAWPRMAATAFQSFDWVRIWFETLGKPQGWKVCIAELRAHSPDGPTVLILPMGFRRVGLLRVMGFLGGEMIDYQAPLIDPDFARALTPDHAARLWRGFIAALPSVDQVRVRRLPATIGELPNPFAALPGARQDESAHAARLPASFAEYAAGRSTGLLADTRRQLRRLSDAGELRMLPLVEDPADLRLVMDALAEQKSRRWQQTGAFDAFALPAFRSFFDRLNSTPLQGVQAVVSALMLDGKPIATHWGLRMGDTLYWLMPTYDEAWAKLSPGRVLMEAAIRRSIDDGLKVFDFTAGDEAYKFQWADRHMPLYSLREAFTTLGRGAYNLQRVREMAREVPALRAFVRRVRGKG
ncbi:GNAT family N-acetyltransferase [Xylophilus rhododendri]|uniref:GNAT family N-acetyltransferase n=1 Tax=Xylophilus rhododendri TaxID=2697032 RepID=A0A857J836_9BURK|nr:GNAT family N-acetyltransferase [Xylophilus rhododendri]QHI99877.1 GNAT family N-acetyltransferase [Xylophilus rhododendri]